MQSISQLLKSYVIWLHSIGLDLDFAIYIKEITVFLSALLLFWIFDILLRKVVMKIIVAAAKRTKTEWDDVLIENRVIKRLLHIVPAYLLHQLLNQIFSHNVGFVSFFEGLIEIYAIVMVILTFNALFKSINQIYQTYPISKERSIKGYLQVGAIVVYFVGGIAIISVLMGESVGILLGGLGAFAAVLMLVFKDSILGLVGGIQLSSNDMLKPGDWISMPALGADGTVMDIGLTIVKVQNFDKTIVTIPTYALVSNSFQNWRGMEQSGSRRMKRSISVDLYSIKAVKPELKSKIVEFFPDLFGSVDFQLEFDAMCLETNLGLFKKYAESYLNKHPYVNQDFTRIVKQMQPTENGMPLEFVAFCKYVSNVEYEATMGQIIEHYISVLPLFELQLFQKPSGNNFNLKA